MTILMIRICPRACGQLVGAIHLLQSISATLVVEAGGGVDVGDGVGDGVSRGIKDAIMSVGVPREAIDLMVGRCILNME